MKKVLFSFLFLIVGFMAVSCSKKDKVVQIEDIGIYEDVEFGGIKVDMSIEDFQKAGFSYGDSCDIYLSNGNTFTNIPFYDGYYVKTGDRLIVGYKGEPTIKFCANNQSGFYKSFKFDDNATITIKLAKKADYLVTQEALSLSYEDDRQKFDSDEIFANFREVRLGSIGQGKLYRGASPVNDVHNRASYVDKFLKDNNVNYVLNLADTNDKVKGYFALDGYNSPYAKSLYENGHTTCLGLTMGYTADSYAITIANGLKEMIKYDAPYYFHCTEGKDRTGFVAVLLEGLMGASVDEMSNDYMITYDNYYKLNKTTDLEKYNAILNLRFTEFLDFFGQEPLLGNGYQAKSYNYLLRGGMTREEIDILMQKLS